MWGSFVKILNIVEASIFRRDIMIQKAGVTGLNSNPNYGTIPPYKQGFTGCNPVEGGKWGEHPPYRKFFLTNIYNVENFRRM